MPGRKSVFLFSAAGLIRGGYLLNVGDEALSDCLSNEIRASATGVQVTRSLTLETAADLPDGFVPTRPLRDLARAISDADLLVVGGGTLLAPHRGLLRAVLGALTIGRIVRTPAAIVAVGVEPSGHPVYGLLLRAICGLAARISVRDAQSQTYLQRFTRKSVELVADPVLLAEPVAAPKIPGSIAINLRKDASDRLVGQVATFTQELGPSRVVLVAMDGRPDRDLGALNRLGRELESRGLEFEIVGPTRDWHEVAAALSEVELCLGMRLHFLLLGAIGDSRLLAISTNEKTKSFASEIGVATVSPEDFSSAVSPAEFRPPSTSALSNMKSRAMKITSGLLEASPE